MAGNKSDKRKKRKLKEEEEEELVEEQLVDRKCLEKAIEMLESGSEESEYCYRHLQGYDMTHSRRLNLKHFCHFQPTQIKAGATSSQALLLQLRRSITEHDWSSAARCIDFMLNLNGKLMPLVWKTCFLVLFNHPDSNPQTINDFLYLSLGLNTEKEKSQFVTRLLTLPENLDKLSASMQFNIYDGVMHDDEGVAEDQIL